MEHVFKRTRSSIRISFLFLDIYSEYVTEHPDEPAGEAIRTAYAETFQQDLDEGQQYEVAMRLAEYSKAAKEKLDKLPPGNAKKPTANTRSFGDYYREAIAGMDTSEKLMWVSGYDQEKARRMYEVEDYEVVDALVNLRQKMADEECRRDYETAMFGFGGKYGTGRGSAKGGESVTTDLRGKTAAEMAAFMASKARRS